MNNLTITDTDRHRFEWQPFRKKTKKNATARKNSMPMHLAHICLCLPTHKPTQRQSQKSAIATALKKGIGLKSKYSLKYHFDFAIL